MSFVMLNRFLDLSDAMDEPDSSAAVIENADFSDTDIPYDFTIPERPYCTDAQREEVGAEAGLCVRKGRSPSAKGCR
jgi:intraflagellar transport protein 172